MFRVLLRNQVPPDSALHRELDVWGIGGIRIGHHCTINKLVMLDGRGQLTIGNNVSISAYVKIITASHGVDARDFAFVTRPVVIEDYVWIGTGAIILPGVVLGHGAVVAAGSVVTKSVGPYEIVGGNPARFIRKRSADLDYQPFWQPLSQ